MSIRNKLLAAIVVASGGTVTNPHNRNELLQDWLDAVVVAVRLVYDFDGIDDYILIPDAALVASDSVGLKFIAPASYGAATRRFLQSKVNNEFEFYIASTGNFILLGCTATIDGNAITSGATMAPTDLIPHDVLVTATGASDLTRVGADEVGFGTANFPIYDLDIQAVSGNRFYPINDGFAANPVIADTLEPAFPDLWVHGDQQPDGTTPALGVIAGDAGGAVPADSVFLATLTWTNLTGRIRILCSTDTSLNTGVQSGGTGSITKFLTSGANTRLQMQDQVGGTVADNVTLTVKETTAGEAMNFNAERWINV